MRNRSYRLDTRFKILGFDMGDIGIMMAVYIIMNQIVGPAIPSRLSLIANLGMVAAVYQIWVRVKDAVPSRFSEHIFSWIAERHDLEVTPDLDAEPVVVDYRAVEDFQRRRKAAERATQRRLREARRKY